MMNFPDAPTLGQVFSLYKWDGAKWTCQADPLTMGDPPSDTNPLMNGVVLPGLEYKYARGDHRHPFDTTKAKPSNENLTGTTNTGTVTITGNIAVTGTFYSLAKGHYFGTPSGNVSPPLKSECNVIFYDVGGDNWCGMGTDSGGNFWIRTGLSGTPGPALFIDQGRNTSFLRPPISPTPGAGDNSTRIATTNFVLSNPAVGPFLPLSGGTTTGGVFYINGDLRTHRNDNTGVIFLNTYGNRYLHYTGNDQYHLVSAHCYTAAGRLFGNGEVGWPILDTRFAFLGDRAMAYMQALEEPYGGGVITGQSGWAAGGGGSWAMRYRQFQAVTSSWWAVGYA